MSGLGFKAYWCLRKDGGIPCNGTYDDLHPPQVFLGPGQMPGHVARMDLKPGPPVNPRGLKSKHVCLKTETLDPKLSVIVVIRSSKPQTPNP